MRTAPVFTHQATFVRLTLGVGHHSPHGSERQLAHPDRVLTHIINSLATSTRSWRILSRVGVAFNLGNGSFGCFADRKGRSPTMSKNAFQRQSSDRVAQLFKISTRVESALMKSAVGRVFILLCILSSPVDFALDLRMGVLLLTMKKKLFAALLYTFLYMSLRLQLILFLATTARPLVDSAKRKKWHSHGVFVRSLECCLEWPIIPQFTVKGVTIAWLPLGLQLMHHQRFFSLLCLEVVYLPLVIIAGPLIIVYGSILGALSIFSREHFYRLSSRGQKQRVRAIVICAVSTSFQAVPQLCIQATVYALGAVPLNPHQAEIAVVSMCFSVLSLLRSACTMLSSWNKCLYIFKLANRTLDEATFNAILSECGDLARSGDSIHLQWDQVDVDAPRGLQHLRGVSFKLASPTHPHNACFKPENVPPEDDSTRVEAKQASPSHTHEIEHRPALSPDSGAIENIATSSEHNGGSFSQNCTQGAASLRSTSRTSAPKGLPPLRGIANCGKGDVV